VGFNAEHVGDAVIRSFPIADHHFVFIMPERQFTGKLGNQFNTFNFRKVTFDFKG